MSNLESDGESVESQNDTNTKLPLAGVKVVDLSRLLPGPWATMLMSDYGAIVTKIEEPTRGDYSRWSQPRYKRESVYFSNVNRNKRSISVDLTTEIGLEIVHRMVEKADVLVESFRPGVADRLGVGYESMSKKNKGLVYCSVTGFGQFGPYSQMAGHDLNITGLSGFINYDSSTMPKVPGLQMGDFAGATMAVIGVLLALRTRDMTGIGQHVDIAMFDSLVSWLSILGATPFAKMAGYAGEPRLEAFGGNPRYSIYQTSDGKFVSVSLLEKSFWERFCVAVGRSDLINADETEDARLSDHGELGIRYRKALSELFLTRTRSEWVEFLLSEGVPCFPVNFPEEVFSDAHLISREMLKWVEWPDEGRIPQLGFPVKGSLMKPRIVSPAPGHGEDSSDILRELGYSEEEIVEFLRSTNV